MSASRRKVSSRVWNQNNHPPIPSPCPNSGANESPLSSSTDIDWKLTYVGSAQSNQYDIELEEVSVGPVPHGINKFMFTSPAPPPEKIPTDEILGVTVILLSGSYKNNEFVRIGYYVNNEYDDEELNNNPPAVPILDRIRRNILAEKPRVTRFAIKWFVFVFLLIGKDNLS